MVVSNSSCGVLYPLKRTASNCVLENVLDRGRSSCAGRVENGPPDAKWAVKSLAQLLALFDASRDVYGGARPPAGADQGAGGLRRAFGARGRPWRAGRGPERLDVGRARRPLTPRDGRTRCRRCVRGPADPTAAAAARRRRPGRFPTPARARIGSVGVDVGRAGKKRAGCGRGVGPARSERRRAARAGSEARSETPRRTAGGDPEKASSGRTLAVD